MRRSAVQVRCCPPKAAPRLTAAIARGVDVLLRQDIPIQDVGRSAAVKIGHRCDTGDISDDTFVAIQIGDNLLIQKVIDEECDIVARGGACAVAVDDSVTIGVAPNDFGGNIVIVYG